MSQKRNAAAAVILATLAGKRTQRQRRSAKRLAKELSNKVELGSPSTARAASRPLLPHPLTRLPKGALPPPVAADARDGAALARQFEDDLRVGQRSGQATPYRAQAAVRQIAATLRKIEVPTDVIRRMVALMGRVKRRQDVLAAMFSRPLLSAHPGPLADPALQQAHSLLLRLGVLFNQAVPPGQTRRSALQDIMRRLRLAQAADPELNGAHWLREKLFDNWRKRFMNAVAAEPELVRQLRHQAGLRLVRNPGGSPSFELWDGSSWNGLDLDHTIDGLSETAAHARHAHELEAMVDASNIALAIPQENSVLLNALRNHTKDLEAKLRASGFNSVHQLDASDVDESIQWLDGAFKFMEERVAP